MRQSADVSSQRQVCMWNLCKLNITETTFTPCRTDIDPQTDPQVIAMLSTKIDKDRANSVPPVLTVTVSLGVILY